MLSYQVTTHTLFLWCIVAITCVEQRHWNSGFQMDPPPPPEWAVMAQISENFQKTIYSLRNIEVFTLSRKKVMEQRDKQVCN